MSKWWLSFADGNLPEGQQFLGAAIVEGFDIISAACEAHRLGCNPGGEVAGGEIPPHIKLPSEFVGVLLSRKRCEEFDAAIAVQGGLD